MCCDGFLTGDTPLTPSGSISEGLHTDGGAHSACPAAAVQSYNSSRSTITVVEQHMVSQQQSQQPQQNMGNRVLLLPLLVHRPHLPSSGPQLPRPAPPRLGPS
jgi:hypothetical protein